MSKRFTEKQFEMALMLIADGRTISQIAKAVDAPHSTVQAHLLNDKERYEEAKERRADRIRSERWERAFDRDDKWSAKFLDDLSLEQLPETRAARKSVNAPDPQEGRAAELADALERLNRILTSQAVQPALPAATTGVAE